MPITNGTGSYADLRYRQGTYNDGGHILRQSNDVRATRHVHRDGYWAFAAHRHRPLRDDGQTIVGCVASPLAVDQAQCVINTLGVGTHAITAEYSGDGNHLASTSPALTQTVTVTTGTTTPVLAAGRTHTCALNSGGAAQCWGRNDQGQFGDTTTTEQHAPVGVAGLGAGVDEITTGAEHSCALTAADGIKCWGDNVYGQVGDGTTIGRTSPVDVSGLTSGIVLIFWRASGTPAR